MAETVKKAKSAAKPRKTASKKKSAAADPAVENHHAATQEHSNNHQNGRHKHVPHDEVARLAHQFWQERGHDHGKHIEDWFRAEQELRGRAS